MATRKKAAPAASTTSAAANPALDELGKLIQQFQLPGIDVAAIVESQRKDIEALVEANRVAYEGIKTLSDRRTEILKESLAQWQSAFQAGEGGKGGKGEGGVAAVAETVKQGVEQAAAHFRELAALEAQTRDQAWQVVQARFQENVANLQKLLQPTK